MHTTDLETRVAELGSEFLRRAADVRTSSVTSDRLMQWAMRDPAFKTQLFRFVDAFPRLSTPDDVHDHLVDYLTQPGVTLPPILQTGLKAGRLAKGTVTKVVTKLIETMGETFIAGRDGREALGALRRLRSEGLAFTIDVLGEACVSEAEAIVYRDRYLELITTLPQLVAGWDDVDRLDTDHLGPIPRVNLSIKLSALHSELDPIDHDRSIDALFGNLLPILEAAHQHGVFLNFDMESHQLKDLTIAAFQRAVEAVPFEAGLAVQAYLRSGDDDAAALADWARGLDRPVTIRLVKGAYWDYETIHAEEMGWPVPVWSRKQDTDACFERMTATFLEAAPARPGEGGVKLALGSHNARSIAYGLAFAESKGLPHSAVELQMLHGMGGQLKQAGRQMGLRVREYVPVGELVPGMAYLVRRLLENTSNESWLLASQAGTVDTATLLKSPHGAPPSTDPGHAHLGTAPERHGLSPAFDGVGDGRPFDNEALRDFSDAATREAFAKAVTRAVVPQVANDATEADADAALARASAAFAGWRDRAAEDRANLIIEVAARLRARRDELSGIIVKEVGKDWRGADADVCEAIDFCEYYARQAAALHRPERLGRYLGEHNEARYEPRGVAAIISPWNFPLAILCGMTTAALSVGNTAIIKPAEPALGIAKVFHEILLEAGIPPDVAILLTGPGRVVGSRLVRDPRVALIAFTGSKAVGLDIIAAAGITPADQPHVKHVVCEMGGKNAIIVDASADFDEAVAGVRSSAFGFQGQKCSAASRLIVVGSAHDEFVDRLVASTAALTIGDPTDPGTDIGPVINRAAAETIRRYIDTGRQEATLALAMDVPETGLMPDRDYVGPHIFVDVSETATIATEEIFGPVLSVFRARDFDDALRLANASHYKLTGGVYSRRPAHLERARREFRVGNLYLNRGTTGALVGRQPFGGFGMSGVGSKAGGRDYLLHFTQPRVVTENTTRRGFAPDLA